MYEPVTDAAAVNTPDLSSGSLQIKEPVDRTCQPPLRSARSDSVGPPVSELRGSPTTCPGFFLPPVEQRILDTNPGKQWCPHRTHEAALISRCSNIKYCVFSGISQQLREQIIRKYGREFRREIRPKSSGRISPGHFGDPSDFSLAPPQGSDLEALKEISQKLLDV